MNDKLAAAAANGAGPRAQGGTTANRAPQAASRVTEVRIEIGQMTLHGVSYHDRTLLTKAMQEELGRLIEGAPQTNWTALKLRRLSAAPYRAGASAEEIGRHVAREIFRGMRSAS